MRVAVVYVPSGKEDRLKEFARGLAAGLESQGHQVSIIDGLHDTDKKLTVFEYLCIGSEPLSFISSKLPDTIVQFLNSSGIVAGKRCFAFIGKRGLASGKSLRRLMHQMEQEGMFLKYSEVFTSASQAQEIGKRLHIK